MEGLAGTQYRVERVESEILSRMISAAWQAAAPLRGMPLVVAPAPERGRPLVMHEAPSEDVARNARTDLVRIFDREGNVVWHREFHRRPDGVRREHQILDDLLTLDVAGFRRKYGIVPERPPAVEAAGAAWAPPAESDPWAGLPRPRRNLLDD